MGHPAAGDLTIALARSYYHSLRIPLGSSPEEVEGAFKFLQDSLTDPADPLRHIQTLKAASEARAALTDPARKRRVDALLRRDIKKSEGLFQKGLAAFRIKDYGGAINLMKQALAIDPNGVHLLEALGLCLHFLGEGHEAIQVFLSATELPTHSPMLFKYLGDSYQLIGDLEEAEHAYRRAEEYLRLARTRETAPEQKRLHLELLADIHRHCGDYEAAEAVLRELVLLSPTADHYTDLAGLYYEMNFIPEGERACDQALAANSHSPGAWLYRGLFFFKRRLLQKAMEALERSLRIDPHQPAIHQLQQKIEKLAKKVGHTIEEIIDNHRNLNPDQRGSVKWYNPETGMGYITATGGEEAFLLYCALDHEGAEARLSRGVEVKFAMVKDDVGWIAVNVNLMETPEVEGQGVNPDIAALAWETGVVIHFNAKSGLGVIQGDGGGEAMFQRSALAEGWTPATGDRVKFTSRKILNLTEKPVVKASRVEPEKPRPH